MANQTGNKPCTKIVGARVLLLSGGLIWGCADGDPGHELPGRPGNRQPQPPILLTLPAFEFTNQGGISCPVQTSHMAKLQQRLARSAGWQDIALVSFSVDPEHDTPAVLTEYGTEYGADFAHWRFLTGQRSLIWDLSKNGFKLPVEERPMEVGLPLFHAPHLVLVDQQLRIRGFYNGTTLTNSNRSATTSSVFWGRRRRQGMAENNTGLFDLLDHGSPGLQKVIEASQASDLDRAQAAYLQYHRDREQPVLNWGESGEERPEAQMASFNFILDPPPTISWRDREKVKPMIHTGTGYSFTRTEGALPTPYTVVDLADMVLEHKVFIPVHRADGPQDLGPEWDWEHLPPIEGQRWPLSLSYQYFLKPLACSYWLTGDERYVAKLVKIIMHYIDYVDGRAEWAMSEIDPHHEKITQALIDALATAA